MDSASCLPVKLTSIIDRPAFRIGAGIFTAVFLLRLLVLVRLTGSPFLLPSQGDMQFYNDWARRIVAGHWTNHHAFYGLPLYPYLLAVCYKVVGYNPFVPAFFHALCEAGTSTILFRLGVAIFAPDKFPSRYRGEIIGALAAFGYAFFLPAQAYAVVLMPTAPFVFVFWFVVWQIVSRPARPSLYWLTLIGALIGFTAMGIASILFLLPLILIALLVRWRSGTECFLFRSKACALLFVGLALGTAPCWVHNYFVAHDPVLLSAHGGVNFWIGNNPTATGYPHFPPGLHAGQRAMLQDSIVVAEKAAGHPLPRSAVSEFWSTQARHYIAHNFGAWLKLLLTKVVKFWSAFQYDDLSIVTILRDQGVLLPGWRFGLVAALGLPGLLIAWFRFRNSRWVTAAILLQMASLLTVFVTERYRLAAVPGLLLGAGYLACTLWENLYRAEYRPAILAGAAVVLSTAFVSLPQRDPSLWALDAYNAGWQALQVNDLVSAQKNLECAYAYVPQNAEVNFALGNLAFAKEDSARARSFYLVTLALDSVHVGAMTNLGLISLHEGNYQQAGNFFAAAAARQPEDARAHYLLAEAQAGAGNPAGALLEIDRALALDPQRPEFLQLRDKLQSLRENGHR